MPFVKGQSGNPGGGKGEKKSQRKRLIRDLMSKHVPTAVKEIAAQLKSDEPKERQWASEMVINYAHGKPSQAVELGDANGDPLKISINLIKNSPK